MFYFIPLVVGCLLLIAATVVRPRLIYEYPYFMAAMFTAFILPQAYALYQNYWGGRYLQDTLLMAALCLGCCWLGYLPRARAGLIEKLNVPINTNRFLHGGVVLVVVGYYFTYKFGTLAEDELSSMMTGIGTIYLFFGGLVYPGFAICFYCALQSRSLLAWIFAFVGAWIPLQAAVFYGRREPTALFLISLAMCFFFLKGKAAPRWLVIGSIIGGIFIIPAVGEYRQMAAEDPLEAFKSLNFAEQFKAYFEEDAISEVKNATVYIAATQDSGDYEWGAGYWNRIVFRFVPAQILGQGFKESLMIGGQLRDPGEFMEQRVGFKVPTGSTVTGLGDSFNQFGFFGCLFFAVVGYLFKNLWTAAIQENGTVAQIFYIQITTTAMRALSHQTIDFLPGLIYSGVFMAFVAFYARERILWQPEAPEEQESTVPEG